MNSHYYKNRNRRWETTTATFYGLRDEESFVAQTYIKSHKCLRDRKFVAQRVSRKTLRDQYFAFVMQNCATVYPSLHERFRDAKPLRRTNLCATN
ncbi:unnamed protein product [Prunus armeniaca]